MQSKQEKPIQANGFVIMARLLKLVVPLTLVMLVTITTGVLGFLAAIFITVGGVYGLVNILGVQTGFSLEHLIYGILILAVLRGIFRYLEHLTGHYIAFKLLALFRDKIFQVLRRLALVKLESKESGELLARVMGDIEMLEIFYAHTIAPISIAIITCTIIFVIIANISLAMALVALAAFVTMGFILPTLATKYGRERGRVYRAQLSAMNNYFLDSVLGIREVLAYAQFKTRSEKIDADGEAIAQSVSKIRWHEGLLNMSNEVIIFAFNIIGLVVGLWLVYSGTLQITQMLMALVLLMASYGPTIALSSLSNNLLQTLASGERILTLLAEKPDLEEVTNGKNLNGINKIQVTNLKFAYEEVEVLKGISFELKKGEILGIEGKSGIGKSTLLKLMQRFYDATDGSVLIDDIDIKEINTDSLRDNITYITQSTYVFNTSVLDNIKIANLNASLEEVKLAAKQAGIDEFIESLPSGYETKISDLGIQLSDGEKQRIALARAFLHKAPVILLDEPTSNLDSLNEALILKSLTEQKTDKAIIIVSHRKSSLNICDRVLSLA